MQETKERDSIIIVQSLQCMEHILKSKFLEALKFSTRKVNF